MKKTKRQQSEALFHDHYAKMVDINHVDPSQLLSPGYQELQKALDVFESVQGKKILDLGCGYGETAVYLTLCGAHVWAIDISNGMVQLARKLAKKHKVSKNCTVSQMAAEQLDFSDNYFDFVFGDGILHHVDTMQALQQVHRVLKKNGLGVFIEPLHYNPLIQLYRRLAKHVRTKDETPLRFTDIARFRRQFLSVIHEEYHLTTLLVFILFFISGIDPNKNRYWKKFRQADSPYNWLLIFLARVDRILLRMFPPLRFLCWNTVIIVKK